MRRSARDWLDPLARFGFFARGLVYVLVGLLSARAAFLTGRGVAGPSEALLTILEAPYGKFLLSALACGLFSFSLFRLGEAYFCRGKGALAVIAKAIGAVGTLVLGLSALSFLLHMRAGGDTSFLRTGARQILSYSWGRPLLVIGGLIAVGAGIAEVVKAFSGKLKDRLSRIELTSSQRSWILRISRLGLLAHGLVVMLVGSFVVRAGVLSRAREVRSTGGALRSIARFPYGAVLLGTVAIGLFAYGLSLWVLARHRAVD
ncbi:MAG: DUF1206 domain-containing protein [Thermoanaerobaculia bacterium]